MGIHMNETLNKIDQLRKQALTQEKAVQEGVSGAKAPEVASKTFDMMERMVRNINGDYSHGRTTIRETITSTDTVSLIPKVIEGQLREAADPELLASKFMNTIHVEGGNNSAVYVVPIIGEMVAQEVSEDGRYPESSLDQGTIEERKLEVRVKKIGLKVRITEEAITDSSWDVLGINVRAMGRAMARYKEQWCFDSFSNHGTIIFDNNLREQMPEAGTRGRAQDGTFNDTLTVEDFLDLVLGMMANDMNPTDVIMHPLAWVVFAQNGMVGNGMTFGALNGMGVHQWGQTQGTPGFAGMTPDMGPQKFIMSPDQVQNRLPMPIAVQFSPFVHFDKREKKFDMYVLDRNNVGVIVEKEGLGTDRWQDPERDLQMLKVKERYGVGILNNGRGITVARNIAVAPTYPVPPRVTIDTDLSAADVKKG